MTSFLPASFDALPFEPIIMGDFSVTMATSADEVLEAQRLRYHVFYETMHAPVPDTPEAREKRDADKYDTVCDHLLVRYHGADSAEPIIVGTYRLLRDVNMAKIGQYYSSSEFDIDCFNRYDGNVLELGRSCTHPDYRQKAAMQLLWRGIGEYIMFHKVDVMFGCASFAGSDPEEHAALLSYLHHFHHAPVEVRPKALDAHYVSMDYIPKDEVDAKRAFFKLPILIKGYLRLGGVVGDGVFLDKDFNTTDIIIVVRTATIDPKYISKYAPDSVGGGDNA